MEPRERELQEVLPEHIRSLEEREASLQRAVDGLRDAYAGLEDLHTTVDLVTTQLRLANELVEHVSRAASPKTREGMFARAKAKARAAVSAMEAMANANVSVDQEGHFKEIPGYDEARLLLKSLLLKGGIGFFDEEVTDRKAERAVANAVARAVAKYTHPDDHYELAFRTERLPGALRALVNAFFSIFAPERQKGPPYGIDEGEEVVYQSRKMRMPLSQAIYYYENERLPDLQARLDKRPGDPLLQHEIAEVRALVNEYKRMTFIPRSTPVILEKDFYTEGLTGYTADGELLVSVEIPVHVRSGTNLDRLQDLVRQEIARSLAGTGAVPELDREVEHLKSLESGLRGSSLRPRSKLNPARAFRTLKRHFPALKQIDDRERFVWLIEFYRKHGRRRTERLVSSMVRSTAGHEELLP
jgi:hypothetical protein